MSLALIATLAVGADALLGEPRRWHPLVGFGAMAQRIEGALNVETSALQAGLRGVLALLVAVLPTTALCALLLYAVRDWPWLHAALQIVVLYLAIGHRSLREHALRVFAALRSHDLPEARRRVGYMVSRQTADMDETRVAAATVESVLENGSDAIFGALFWFAVGGAPAALAYRLCNTLDAMWGYRTPRYRHFGWAAARFDDVINWLPARLTALSYALVSGQARTALRCWQEQAPRWDSPNGGPVMAAGAGALGLQLGGAAFYHGVLKPRPPLGQGRAARAGDIPRSLLLPARTLLLWLAAFWLLEALAHA